MAENKFLVYLCLGIFLLTIISCNTVRSQKLTDPAQLPPSQEDQDIRTMPPYILDVGDEVTIRVVGNGFKDIERTAIINNTGEIYFPYVGPVKLAGQSVPKARERMIAGLKKYFVDPQVEFTTNASRQQVYVFGEVNAPGTFSYRRPLIILEGIAKAGWFNRDANRQRVLLIRRAQNRYNVFAVNTGDFLKDGSKIQEFYLQSGDVVFVTPKTISNIEWFMKKIQNSLQPILTAEQMIILWPLLIDVIKGNIQQTTISIP